jgi:hypothetical protein
MVSEQPSPELIAANERLLHMRAQYRAERTVSAVNWDIDLPFQRGTMAGSAVGDRRELNPAGSNYSSRF